MVVDKIWKEIRGNQGDIQPSMERFGGYKAKAKARTESKERLVLKKWKRKNT